MTNSNLKERLGRRETWLQIAGMLAYYLVLALHLTGKFAGIDGAPEHSTEEIIGLVAAYAHALGLVGAGTIAQVKRGEQRGAAIWRATGVDEARVEQLITRHERSGAHGVAAPKLKAVALTTEPPDPPDTTDPLTTAPMPPKDPLPAHVANLERRLQRLEHPLAGDGSPPGAAVAAVPGGGGSNPSPATTTPPPNAT